MPVLSKLLVYWNNNIFLLYNVLGMPYQGVNLLKLFENVSFRNLDIPKGWNLCKLIKENELL